MDCGDLDGEARFVDALAPRQARILDAGCGPGRVGSALARLGHEVVGVDVDPVLIAATEQDHPGPRWLVGDLAELDLAAAGVHEGFDVIVCAGNVLTFLAPATRRDVLANLGGELRDDGRIAVGFGAGRGYDFDEFRADAGRVGLVAELELESCGRSPRTATSSWRSCARRRSRDPMVTVGTRDPPGSPVETGDGWPPVSPRAQEPGGR